MLDLPAEPEESRDQSTWVNGRGLLSLTERVFGMSGALSGKEVSLNRDEVLGAIVGSKLTRHAYRDRVYQNDGFPPLIDLVDSRHQRILDVGCGDGANMRLLKARGHDVEGITLSEAEARIVRSQGFTCHVADINWELPTFCPGSFDGILLSHVLEHFVSPVDVLKELCRMLLPGGGVYVVLPNVLQFQQRWELVRGHFQYAETGIMDRTHLRFFDFYSAGDLVRDAGLEVVRHEGIGQCPMGPFRELTPGFSRRIDRLVSKWWPGLFAFHIVVVGRLSVANLKNDP